MSALDWTAVAFAVLVAVASAGGSAWMIRYWSVGTYGVTCYSAGQAIIDTESTGAPRAIDGSLSFTERGTGKLFVVTGDCIIAKE